MNKALKRIVLELKELREALEEQNNKLSYIIRNIVLDVCFINIVALVVLYFIK